VGEHRGQIFGTPPYDHWLVARAVRRAWATRLVCSTSL
jgi:hypothetical protein